MRALLLILLALAVLPAAAQSRGSCAPGAARAELADGDVRAELFINGNLFFDAVNNTAQYVVPAASGVSPLYAGHLWVGGTNGGTLRMAAAMYDPFAFRPGPLGADGTAPSPTDCSAYDRIFVVSADDLAAYEATGVTTPDLAAWPVRWGAEAVDGDGDPTNYSLAGGDRPRLYGTETAFWVMNDVAGPAGALSSATPVGLEVQVTAAAFDSPDPAFAQATIYRFRLVKRSPGVLADARAGVFLDVDLGDAGDDYVGSDTLRSMAFVYNGDDVDQTIGGIPGYGAAPPALGYDWLTGAGVHIRNLTSGGSPYSYPDDSMEAYRYMNGQWRNGQPMREGGAGNGTTGRLTSWIFSGDPVKDQFWSEENTDGAGNNNTPNDRKSYFATSTFALAPNVPVDVVLALPFARGSDRLDSVTQLRAASDAIQAAYDGGALFPVAGEATAPPWGAALVLSAVRPNPAAGVAEITVTVPAAGAVRVAVVDVLGRTVAVAHDGPLSAGPTTVRLPGGLAPGVYAVVAESSVGRTIARLTVAR